MRQPPNAMSVFAIALLAVAASSCSKPDAFQQFDSIVTEELIRNACEHDVPFSFTTEHTPGQRKYQADFELGSEDPELFASVTVTIGKAGTLLDPAEYEKNKKEVREEDIKNPPDMRWEAFLFPNIGKRAMAGLVLGPGGGGDSLIFTTNDERFDIKIEQGNHLADNVKNPGVSCNKIAKDICSRYDSKEHR